ncbi:unnamed protein product [Soboliphyme baturini]|uniref:G_PROTEIN_RECEP_F1_2 domain-containing protein n=1 Tax=Soboliphyme baturini TaxID=241478 RepID=A0A183IJP7_9BILA|nr:unnamed protein product [Soboliphyme baturini]
MFEGTRIRKCLFFNHVQIVCRFRFRNYAWRGCNDTGILLTAKLINADLRSSFRTWITISIIVSFVTVMVSALLIAAIAFGKKWRSPSLRIILVMCSGHLLLAAAVFYRNTSEGIRIALGRSSAMTGLRCFRELVPFYVGQNFVLFLNILVPVDRLVFLRFPRWYASLSMNVVRTAMTTSAFLYVVALLIVEYSLTTWCLVFTCAQELTTSSTFVFFKQVDRYVKISIASLVSIVLLVAVKTRRERRGTENFDERQEHHVDDQTMVAVAMSVLCHNVLLVLSQLLYYMASLYYGDNEPIAVGFTNSAVIVNFVGIANFLIFAWQVRSFQRDVIAFLIRLLSLCHMVDRMTVLQTTSSMPPVVNRSS